MKLNCLIASTLLLGLVQIGRAELVYQQNFESLNVSGLNGQGGFIAPATTSVTGTDTLAYTNGALSYSGGTKGGTATGLSNAYVFSNTFPSQSGDVYFSLLCSWTGQLDNDIVVYALTGQASLATPPNLRAAGGVRVNNNAMSGGEANFVNIHARNTDGSTTTVTTNGPAGPVQGNANFLVGRIWKSVPGAGNPYDRVSIWVNPSATTEGAPSLTVNQTLSVTTLDKLYMMVGSGNETAEVFRFDNLLVGTTFADVVNTPLAPPDAARGTLILISSAKAGRKSSQPDQAATPARTRSFEKTAVETVTQPNA